MGIVAWFRDLRGPRREGPFFGSAPVPPERVPYPRCHHHGRQRALGPRHHLPVIAGHRAGTKALKRVVKAALRAGVRQLTVYSFSTENWTRPA